MLRSAMSKVLLALTMFGLSLPVIAPAQTIDPLPEEIIYDDPADLFVGNGVGGSCPEGGCGAYKGEVNPTTGAFSVFFNASTSSGQGPLINPLLLILAVPNDTSNGQALTGASLTGASFYDNYKSSGAGGTAVSVPFSFGVSPHSYELRNEYAGYQGNFTAGDVYSFLDIGTGIPNSNNVTNWSTWDSAINHVAVDPGTGFGIYVFSLNIDTAGVTYGSGDLLNIGTQGLPDGTFAVAFGQQQTTVTTTTKKRTTITSFGTPFTQAGLKDSTPTPEPATALLGGCALLAALVLVRRKGLRS